MQEFVYYTDKDLEFPLSEYIKVTSDITDSNDYIVSNSKKISAHVIADEIDFYINNSNDSIADKIKNIQKLYEINATRFDLAQDISHEEYISNSILLVSNDVQRKDVLSVMDSEEFSLYCVNDDVVKSVEGHIGNFNVVVNDNFKDKSLNVSQIIWYNQDSEVKKRSGVYDPNNSSLQEVVETIKENIIKYKYKKYLTYDKNICQRHERRGDVCGKCVEVCPTVAIVKDDENKNLVFSDIDCMGCGGCISVCPSGALDYAPTSRESIYNISMLYKNHIPLIIPRKMDIQNLHVELKQNILPLKIEGEKFLHEATLLTLAQESGSQVIFYSDFISKGTGDAIDILNEIYQKRYGVDAIIVAMNEEELAQVINKANLVENSQCTINEINTKKREAFATRLKYIVGDDDLGEVKTGEHIHYAKVNVKEDNCTLCLACVGACNVDALTANIDDNSLRINPSICTGCGYCEVSCPEADCLSIEQDVIKLTPSWFKEEVLAKDTLFACVECGKEFATTKAVQKIANMMAPLFKNDPIKERTLYCCEDCKAKVMMASYRKNPKPYNNKQGIQ